MPTAAISDPMKPTFAPLASPAAATAEQEGVLAFPASIAQQMFWYLELLQGEVTAFNVPLRFRLDGPLDVPLLERSLNTIIDRHEALRTRFGEDNGELLQIVMPELKLQIPVIDISHFPPDRITDEAERLGSVEAHRPFSLATGPMIRAELIRLGPVLHILHLSVHHALFDGMSMTVLTRELAEIYRAYFDGKPSPLEPLPIQYGDYSVWQKEFLEGPEMKQQLGYWKKRLDGMNELDLPTDFPRPPVKSWKGDITSALLPRELTDKLQTIAAKHGATLFHLQLAAFMILLHRYTGSTDIAVGTPVTGRTRGEIEPLVGVFINSLILRCDLSGNPDFGAFLGHVRETALEAMENQELPFECLVRELRPERDPSRNPLFQVNFNHHRSFAQAGTFGGVTLTPIPSRSPGTIFDLHFFMVERKEGWRASCDYSTELFTRTSADRMLGHFKHLLEGIAAHPEKPVGQLEILTDPEKSRLRKWSEHTRDYPRDATIGGLFLETAERFPHRTALESGDRKFTYQQLRSEATTLAARLLKAGVKPGDTVAITARPGPEMIAGFLGTLLAGACCVPIDPSYPADHFAMLLDECGANTALAGPGCEASSPESWHGKRFALTPFGSAGAPVALPNIAVTADHPAQLLFTSGSTGRPKGVLLSHRGTVRLVRNNGFIAITPDDVFLQAAPVSFDASLLEIWGALLNGGRLILMPEGPGLEGIATAVRDKGVTILWLTSGLFQLMIDEHAESLTSLRHLLAGGDVLSPAHVRKALDALPGTRLLNGYGPTENTTFTTCHEITAGDLDHASIPIGRPISNTTVHILDDQHRPVPVGIPGELCTGGDGLALGYLKSPELTSEKFITHPEFGRLYHTGDLARWSADGTIEFIGRRDHQVKVRGFRIELGEIEAVLASHPKVLQTKATVRGDTAETKRIVTWVVPNDGAVPTGEEIAAFLAERLPAFMRPDGIGVLDSFPLNTNGKIELAALPDPGHRISLSENTPHEAPVGPVESQLAVIWQELLGIPKVGRNDRFFALGGHSLMALRLFSRINREFRKSLPLSALIQHPTIATLATLLEDTTAERPAPRSLPRGAAGSRGHLVTLAEGGDLRPLFCIHGGDGGALFYRRLTEFVPDNLPVHAIESCELGNSGPVLQSSIEETAEDYLRTILKLQAKGPFHLAGYSFGGVVAHEIACRLIDQGHEVGFLGLFDTHSPTAAARKYSLIERLGVFWRHNDGHPVIKRIGLLGARIRAGIHTHREVRTELEAAAKCGPAEAFSNLRRVQIREENWRAMRVYRPRPFNGRITLFRTTHLDDKVEWPADYGWSEAALSGLDIVPVSGHHLDLFNPENIQSLADALTRSLTHTTPPTT